MGTEKMRKPRTRVTKNTRTEVLEDQKTRSQKERDALNEELDAVLDEIDEVLEHNAEEFLKGYVQKGGQ